MKSSSFTAAVATNTRRLSTITCPKCGKNTSFVRLIDAIDELGEVYSCNHCKWPFHYCL